MSIAATKSVALKVLRRLRQAGFEALFAGGCVRDMLLGLRSSDYDVATNATPQQVRKLFRHVLLVGAKFGVAMVVENKRKVEVTTFRTDLTYEDGRRPVGVTFTNAREDALRRDFTINGMFFDPVGGEVIDYVGGRADLERRIVRTIGLPRERFAEDYLRMIRAVRFAVRFGFEIDPGTAQAIRQYAPNIASISGERICEELTKMLARDSAAEAMKTLGELGLAEVVLPELSKAGLWERALRRSEMLARHKDATLELAALLAELSEKEIVGITRRWGASNELREGLCWMAEHWRDWPSALTMPLHKFKRLLAHPQFARLMRLWRAAEKLEKSSQVQARAIKRRVDSIRPEHVAPPPLVTGDDLKSLGLRQGPQLGRILRALYDAQLDEVLRDRQAALEQARHMIHQEKQ